MLLESLPDLGHDRGGRADGTNLPPEVAVRWDQVADPYAERALMRQGTSRPDAPRTLGARVHLGKEHPQVEGEAQLLGGAPLARLNVDDLDAAREVAAKAVRGSTVAVRLQSRDERDPDDVLERILRGRPCRRLDATAAQACAVFDCRNGRARTVAGDRSWIAPVNGERSSFTKRVVPGEAAFGIRLTRIRAIALDAKRPTRFGRPWRGGTR
jgi:hypothetical protein